MTSKAKIESGKMNRGRTWIVLLLLISLIAAGLTRHWASVLQHSGVAATSYYSGSAANLSRMNSYALALLLGGLRGPLVMFLWPSAEEQKNEKKLEDFDTKIEWIRLLQAEFDTVHIFQIWNKAYNISVQMANLGNKYRTILDALDYAYSVDAERPNNINILTEIARTYFDKLGNSAEKAYYRRRVREESQARQELVRIILPPDRKAELIELALDAGLRRYKLQFFTDQATGRLTLTVPKPVALAIQQKFNGPGVEYQDRPRTKINRDDPSWRRTELDPILDENGYILPQYLKPKFPAPGAGSNDGGELQYLKRFQPFPYGLSPFALGYNYFKRAQVLQSVNKQRHAQLSDLVIDSRPALALKNWSEEEWEYGRAAELEAINLPIPSERLDMELPTADLKLDDRIAHRPQLDEAIFSYARSAQLVDAALEEYQRHLQNFQTNITNYLSHIDELQIQKQLVLGDHDFLVAMIDPGQREQLARSAADHYRQAIHRAQIMSLQHFVPDDVAQRYYPQGLTRAQIPTANLSPSQLSDLYESVCQARKAMGPMYMHAEEFDEYFKYIRRAQARLKNLPS